MKKKTQRKEKTRKKEERKWIEHSLAFFVMMIAMIWRGLDSHPIN
jgi:cytochrome c oxidase assembly protein Cox11